MFRWYTWIFCCTLLIACKNGQEESNEHAGISLNVIPSEDSGVNFNNKVSDTKELNIFYWNFFYQGAGVGIGDLNGDSLPDLYFCGNQVPDKLYLNKGGFKFKDVSNRAGIEDNSWSTGVAFADVNADGLLDIYVCKNGYTADGNLRRNKLFINEGDMRFKESAAQFGLADDGFSVQASFFDADYDGDLDMYLVNQPVDQYAQYRIHPQDLSSLPHSDKLYINQNGKYFDFTQAAQLQNTRYGLSALTSDFDNDGRTDIYVCNDYFHGDQMLMNKARYRFIDELSERLKHTSFYSMGSDAADINKDGWMDFVVLDMSFSDHYRSKTNMSSMDPNRFDQIVENGHNHQYMFNQLQLNHGNGKFSEIETRMLLLETV